MSTSMLVAATMISAAILGGAFVIGTFIALANTQWKILGVSAVALFGAFSATTVIFWLAVYAAVRPRLKKFSVTQWLTRRRPRFKS
jgi:hypothetical protein